MLAGRGMPATSSTLKPFFFFLIFPHFREDLDQEEKARFGELCSCENGKGREWFARYVSAQVRGEMGEGAASLYWVFGAVILCWGFGAPVLYWGFGAAWAGGSDQGV